MNERTLHICIFALSTIVAVTSTSLSLASSESIHPENLNVAQAPEG
jgi:hypothetical protein